MQKLKSLSYVTNKDCLQLVSCPADGQLASVILVLCCNLYKLGTAQDLVAVVLQLTVGVQSKGTVH